MPEWDVPPDPVIRELQAGMRTEAGVREVADNLDADGQEGRARVIRRDLEAFLLMADMTQMWCGARSAQGTICERERGHGGCHEAFVEGDSRRWWGDARWAPWEWIVYEWETGH